MQQKEKKKREELYSLVSNQYLRNEFGCSHNFWVAIKNPSNDNMRLI